MAVDSPALPAYRSRVPLASRPLNLNGSRYFTTEENIMLPHHLRRLTRRLIIVLVLAAALLTASASPAERKAQAFTPCDQCWEEYNNCVISCGDPAPGACLFFCEWQYNRCLQTCS
jgi:hypothetical protein